MNHNITPSATPASPRPKAPAGELLAFLSAHAADPPYIPERDDEPCLSEVLAELHDAELAAGHLAEAHDTDLLDDGRLFRLAPGHPGEVAS